jgi:hypothetical protein
VRLLFLFAISNLRSQLENIDDPSNLASSPPKGGCFPTLLRKGPEMKN